MVSVSLDEYLSAFEEVRTLTDIVKYRDFQYCLLTNCIFTNNHLYHWRKVEMQNCEICKTNTKQAVVYLFWECKKVSDIWDQLKQFIVKCVGAEEQELNITLKNVL